MRFTSYLLLFSACVWALIVSCSKGNNKAPGTPTTTTRSFVWTGVDVTTTINPYPDTSWHLIQGQGSFDLNFDSLINYETGGVMHFADVDTFRFHSCTVTLVNPDSFNNFQNVSSVNAEGSDTASIYFTIADRNTNSGDTTAVMSIPVDPYTDVKTCLTAAAKTQSAHYTYVVSMIRKSGTGFAFYKPLTATIHVEYYIHASK